MKHWILNLFDCFLSNLHWWRKLRGGIWGKWWIDTPVNSMLWLTMETPEERPGLARGRPAIEDYRGRGHLSVACGSGGELSLEKEDGRA